MSNTTILVTGSTGFIGKALVSALLKPGVKVIAPVRSLGAENYSEQHTQITVPDLADINSKLFQQYSPDTVIHVAAKAHIVGVPLSEFRRVNTEATLHLARLAADAGVRRFIFLSSIGVHGISNIFPFKVTDKPTPMEDYAVSKLEAEVGLKQVAQQTGMEVVILRPPLVYGPDAPGNFGKLANLARKNLPLPLGAIHNKRSLVALDNLVDLIITCIDHPKAANQTFLVSDDQDVSTAELLQMMTKAAGKTPRLIPVPMSWLKFVGKLTGKQAVVDRLCGNLQVDIRHTKETLGWTPPITVEEGIDRCFTLVTNS
ncbi:SDR family oxidoreductase [Chromatiaceae bacterium AAb-1]|nr:SDR family oxidoreductase [Chromatiaceae bacterium AAb-1]